MSEFTSSELNFLADVLPPVRDVTTGKYAKTTKTLTPYRKVSVNFREIVNDFLQAHGGYTEDVIVDLFQSLLMWARMGDTNAAKILLDRLCGKDPEILDVAITSKLTDTERAVRLRAILALAEKRAREENGDASSDAT